MKKEKPGTQGLGHLQTWRAPFSLDIKRRRRQTLENRRAHRLRGLRPDSVLGTPEYHWTEPPRLDASGEALNASPKGRGKAEHAPVFFARKVRRTLHRSRRHGRARA
jgi:hypothetical protein